MKTLLIALKIVALFILIPLCFVSIIALVVEHDYIAGAISTLLFSTPAYLIIRSFRKKNIYPVENNEQLKDKKQRVVRLSSFEIMQVQNKSIQLLESLEIIHSTASLDTLIGRINFIDEIYPTFLNACHSKRYVSDIQIGIDRYKTMYYDRIIKEPQMQLIAEPNADMLKMYYANCIVSCYSRYVDKQEAEISKLKRQHAIEKRKNDIINVGYSAKYIFKTHNIPDNGHLDSIENIRKLFYSYQKDQLSN